MKTQILSMRYTPISLIGFLLFMTTTFLGCGVFYNVNRVITGDSVLLTQDDLHGMGLGKSNLIRPLNDVFVIKGFQQRGYELTVQYWLFNSSSAARKAAEMEWVWRYAAPGNFHPDLNPEDVIGDTTWRRIHKSWEEWEKGSTHIYFVKYNLLVYIKTEGFPSNRLQSARDAARKIDAKIETVLLKNGKTVISRDGQKNRSVRLWDVKTGNLLKTLKGDTSDGLESVSFSPDGKTIVSGDRWVRLWDVNTGDLLKIFTGHTDWITSVSFSPNGKRIVSGSYDDTVRLWDVETGNLLKTLKGHKWIVTSVGFSPDGKTLASGSWDKTVRLWDTIKSKHRLWDAIREKPLKTLKGHTGWVLSVSFSPDGRTLASGGADGTVRLWDVNTGNLLKTLKGHAGGVLSVSFSPDSKTLASGNVDGSVWLWDVEIGNLLRILEGHKGDVLSVRFLPDGKMLVGGILDETLLLWDTSFPLDPTTKH